MFKLAFNFALILSFPFAYASPPKTCPGAPLLTLAEEQPAAVVVSDPIGWLSPTVLQLEKKPTETDVALASALNCAKKAALTPGQDGDHTRIAVETLSAIES